MIRILCTVLVGFLTACAVTVLLDAQSTPSPHVWRIADAPADLKAAISRADTFITAQHSALVRQLTRALTESGAARAIQACHLDATNQAFWVGRQRGYPIGRTSDRLRSPTNAPRPWAASIVREYAGRQAADVDGFAADLGDRLGVLRPITMRPICESCHGSPEKIRPAVRAVLTDRYPQDRALGFKPGEIRGWYWMEIPKAAGTDR